MSADEIPAPADPPASVRAPDPSGTRRRQGLLLGVAAALVFLVALFSPNDNSGSDSHFSLVVSQAILDHGTTRLDPYEHLLGSQMETFGYQVEHVEGHLYYTFPLGTSIAAVPAVWVSNLFGQNMTVVEDNYRMQNVLSALSCAGVFLALYAVGRLYVGATASLTITLIGVFGTSLTSTLATALWNLDLAVLLTAVSLLLLIHSYRGSGWRAAPYLLGLAMAGAFLSRPTAAVFIGLGLVALLARRPRAAVKAGVVALVPLLLYAGMNQIEQGSPIPWYFGPARLLDNERVDLALYGLLLSPSRGLFVFSPFLLIILLGSPLLGRPLTQRRAYWFALAWFGLLVATVASFEHWWGGHSYGPRLLTEAVLPLMLIAYLSWEVVSLRQTGRRRAVGRALVAMLGVVAIVIHTVQGLFNPAAVLWNAYPSIDAYPQYVFDWRYPQFATTLESLHTRHLEHLLAEAEAGRLALGAYHFGEACSYPASDQGCILVGVWRAGEAEYWTETREAHILLQLGAVDAQADYCLGIRAGALDSQRAHVLVNGQPVGRMSFSPEAPLRRVPVPRATLGSHRVNTITVRLPDARFPGLEDVRQLGLRYVPHRLGLRNMRLVLNEAEAGACQ
jgi:hypothetical protein